MYMHALERSPNSCNVCIQSSVTESSTENTIIIIKRGILPRSLLFLVIERKITSPKHPLTII